MRHHIGRYIVIITASILLAGCTESTDTVVETTREISGVGQVYGINTTDSADEQLQTEEEESNQKAESGNTAGNLVNSGIVAEKDGYIYYFNKADGNKLYRESTDGSVKEELCNVSGPLEINVTAKNVYFQSGNIYQVNIEAKEAVTLIKGECRNVVIYDSCMYYIIKEEESFKIHKMSLITMEDEVLSENVASYLNVSDGWIYYINGSDSSTIYKMKTDGTEEQKVSSSSGIEEMVVSGSYIYYVGGNLSIYRMSLEGNDKTEIIADNCRNLNIYDNELFYYSEKENAICKATLGGGSVTNLLEGNYSAINVISDKIYYFNSDDYNYYKMDKDGSNVSIAD